MFDICEVTTLKSRGSTMKDRLAGADSNQELEDSSLI